MTGWVVGGSKRTSDGGEEGGARVWLRSRKSNAAEVIQSVSSLPGEAHSRRSEASQAESNGLAGLYLFSTGDENVPSGTFGG